MSVEDYVRTAEAENSVEAQRAVMREAHADHLTVRTVKSVRLVPCHHRDEHYCVPRYRVTLAVTR